MANLKEILPMILAGLGGAASPQGANVFSNILQQKTAGEERKARDLDREERIKLARLASDRAGSAEERAVTREEGVTSLRQMRMDEITAKNKELERIRKSEGKLIDYYRQENPHLAPVLQDVTKADAEKIVEAGGGETMDQTMDRLDVIAGRGFSGQIPLEGGGSVGTRPPAAVKPGEPELPKSVVASGIIVEGQSDLISAQTAREDAETDLDVILSGEGDTLVGAGDERKARSALRAAHATERLAEEKVVQQLREKGFTEEEVNEYLGKTAGGGEPTDIVSHAQGPLTVREQFFLANPELRGAPGFEDEE